MFKPEIKWPVTCLSFWKLNSTVPVNNALMVFCGWPFNAKRVTVMFSANKLNLTLRKMIQVKTEFRLKFSNLGWFSISSQVVFLTLFCLFQVFVSVLICGLHRETTGLPLYFVNFYINFTDIAFDSAVVLLMQFWRTTINRGLNSWKRWEKFWSPSRFLPQVREERSTKVWVWTSIILEGNKLDGDKKTVTFRLNLCSMVA